MFERGLCAKNTLWWRDKTDNAVFCEKPPNYITFNE